MENAEEIINPNETPMVRYSSHPIQNLNIGTQYKFENAVMLLTEEDAAVFDELIPTLDIATQNRIRKIDADLADRFVREHMALAGATKLIDSASAGVANGGTQVGTEELGTQTEGAPAPAPTPTPTPTPTGGLRLGAAA